MSKQTTQETPTRKSPPPRLAENKSVGPGTSVKREAQTFIPLAQDVSSQVAMLKRLPPAQQQSLVRNISSTQGNWHMQRLMKAYAASRSAKGGSPVTLQTKLTGDAYEQEADAVAAFVGNREPLSQDRPNVTSNYQAQLKPSAQVQRAEVKGASQPGGAAGIMAGVTAEAKAEVGKDGAIRSR